MNPLRLTLRQLQIFVAVAQSGSTNAAAQAVALSQSATSSAVNELERLLAVQLFDRTGKRLYLNENGRALLPLALAQIDGAAEIERLAVDPDAMTSLRLGASTTIGNHVIPRMLPMLLGGGEFGARSASASATVRIGNTEAICDEVASFALDAGLVEGPSGNDDLVETPWLQDELVLVASPTLAGEQPEPVSSGALAGLRWLLREKGSGTREVTDQLLLPYVRRYGSSLVLGSSEAIVGAAAEGIGVACLSRWVVDSAVASGRLCILRTEIPRMSRQCYVVTHRNKHATRGLKRFLDLADQWGRSMARMPGYAQG
ncbi:LysR substrate-binding domain-containing protein [Pseudorhodoferax soli]|uniref:Transcriptional regulator n=1 Tax=Pseudorhodoferax soli TaxID=545864 RepID=A0A368XL58_9BURK|nr:LysR substrate-binding domain-containing protein [Pseudorhodoferax soli]RCW68585.1 transcriptional regulator [Pseudorhodoferax soli]